MAIDDGTLYVAEFGTGGTSELWTCTDPTTLSSCTPATLPSGITSPAGYGE